MDKLTLTDIRKPAEYAGLRDALRRRVIELKRPRRISVGPQVTLLFENRDTMLFQVEEMCRAEGLASDEQIQQELDIYNAILPDPGQLAATLFIEVQSEAAVARVLDKLIGLQEHVWLVIGGSRIKATFDPEQFATDKLAAVQYLKFPLTVEEQAELPRPGTAVALAIDHPQYRHQAHLDEASRRSLAADLD
ncbi:MAG TPA: DUF3501 family protein [Polyangia bacterium]|jgi:hypothetical protein